MCEILHGYNPPCAVQTEGPTLYAHEGVPFPAAAALWARYRRLAMSQTSYDILSSRLAVSVCLR